MLATHISLVLNEIPQRLLTSIENKIKDDGTFKTSSGKGWLAVFPNEWIAKFGSDNWSHVHHEFYCKNGQLFITFHVEGEYKQGGIMKPYQHDLISAFDNDNIDLVVKKAVEKLQTKHDEVKQSINNV